MGVDRAWERRGGAAAPNYADISCGGTEDNPAIEMLVSVLDSQEKARPEANR